jgi:hypothetical protein
LWRHQILIKNALLYRKRTKKVHSNIFASVDQHPQWKGLVKRCQFIVKDSQFYRCIGTNSFRSSSTRIRGQKEQIFVLIGNNIFLHRNNFLMWSVNSLLVSINCQTDWHWKNFQKNLWENLVSNIILACPIEMRQNFEYLRRILTSNHQRYVRIFEISKIRTFFASLFYTRKSRVSSPCHIWTFFKLVLVSNKLKKKWLVSVQNLSW